MNLKIKTTFLLLFLTIQFAVAGEYTRDYSSYREYVCMSNRHKIISKPYIFPFYIAPDDHLSLFMSAIKKDPSLSSKLDDHFCTFDFRNTYSDKVKQGFKEIDIGQSYFSNVFVQIAAIVERTDNGYTERIFSRKVLMEKIPNKLAEEDWKNIELNAAQGAKNFPDIFTGQAKLKEVLIVVSMDDKSSFFGGSRIYDQWIPNFIGADSITSVKRNTPSNTVNTNVKVKEQPINKKQLSEENVTNKRQLALDKNVAQLASIDAEVQSALKKIPKKQKKKVELKPYLETVVVCTPPNERGSFKCYGPNGSFSGHPNQPKGYKTPEEVVTMNMKWSCPDQKRFASVNNHSIWGCGSGATGSVSSKDSSQGLPIPERATYYCKPKQIGCKNQSPTQAEN